MESGSEDLVELTLGQLHKLIGAFFLCVIRDAATKNAVGSVDLSMLHLWLLFLRLPMLCFVTSYLSVLVFLFVLLFTDVVVFFDL